MVLWVGVDDTDSLRGMCTTFLAAEIVRAATEEWDLIGYPRLVRLNPNIPWKTRGNGAIGLRFGKGVGPPQVVGQIQGREIRSFPRAEGTEDPETLRPLIERLVERWSVMDDPTTNPGFAILRTQPRPGFYWQAVRTIVSLDDATEAARGLGLLRGYKNGRGIVGSVAALSWTPGDRTYEVLAYRDPSRWGRRREVVPASVVSMDRTFPSTFNNYDHENGQVVLAPHSPCPILFGIRGDVAEDLPVAMRHLRGEPPSGWLLFETNQGTDDHVQFDDWSLCPYTATSVEGIVAATPTSRRGGHVLFDLLGRALVTVATYEPSKQFRQIVRALRPGDWIRVWGSVRDEPRSLNLEKIEVISLAEDFLKSANPRCVVCGKSMKSVGRGAGYRCARGHTRLLAHPAPLRRTERRVAPGRYEPPVSARRHLAKPLKRMLSMPFETDRLRPTTALSAYVSSSGGVSEKWTR
jgi:tRNA(Ile2)-agmatinylcytidine synthase